MPYNTFFFTSVFEQKPIMQLHWYGNDFLYPRLYFLFNSVTITNSVCKETFSRGCEDDNKIKYINKSNIINIKR